MWAERFGEFVLLFLVINPFEVLPSFLALTKGLSQRMRRRIALRPCSWRSAC
jgi:small neutral amino acid transporter SnatA (MarC family)